MKKECEVMGGMTYLKQGYESKFDAVSQRGALCGCTFCT